MRKEDMPIHNTCIIYDLDGTISDDEWRRQKFLSFKPTAASWSAYFSHCGQDNLINPHLIDFDHDIVIFTGRPTTARSLTIGWLREVGILPPVIWKDIHYMSPYDCRKHNRVMLFMRESNDFRPNWEVKKDLLENFIIEEPDTEIVMAYDDDPAVIKMYKRHGIPCQLITKG